MVSLNCKAASATWKQKSALNRNISQIHLKYIKFMVARALLRNNVSTEEWLATTTFGKCCILNCSLRLITRKCFLGATTLL